MSIAYGVTPFRWRALLHREKLFLEAKGIVNGCGSRKGWRRFIRPPGKLFTASCKHHDFNYWLGGTEADRKWSDDAFLTRMLVDVQRLSYLNRWHGKLRAYTFHLAVRTFGRGAFEHGEQKGWKDLTDLGYKPGMSYEY